MEQTRRVEEQKKFMFEEKIKKEYKCKLEEKRNQEEKKFQEEEKIQRELKDTLLPTNPAKSLVDKMKSFTISFLKKEDNQMQCVEEAGNTQSVIQVVQHQPEFGTKEWYNALD